MDSSMTIHRRAEAWDAGDIPESLITLVREHCQTADAWHVLAKSGRHGYRASGMELEVDNRENTHDASEIAGAIGKMLTEHHDAHAAPFYRVDAMADGKMLAQVVLKLGPDGPEDLQSMSGGAWALKELGATHKRYLELLDKIGGVVDLAATCMDAMAGAVGAAADARMTYASGENENANDARSHEKQMAVLQWLMTQTAASKQGNPLASVMAEMPQDLLDKMREIVGADCFELFVRAAGTHNPAERRNILTAALERIPEPAKVALASMLPKEWHAKLMAAFQAVLQEHDAGTNEGPRQPNGVGQPQPHQ
jgi:hypothetical protein